MKEVLLWNQHECSRFYLVFAPWKAQGNILTSFVFMLRLTDLHPRSGLFRNQPTCASNQLVGQLANMTHFLKTLTAVFFSVHQGCSVKLRVVATTFLCYKTCQVWHHYCLHLAVLHSSGKACPSQIALKIHCGLGALSHYCVMRSLLYFGLVCWVIF